VKKCIGCPMVGTHNRHQPNCPLWSPPWVRLFDAKVPRIATKVYQPR
jgi:hypothetical protein